MSRYHELAAKVDGFFARVTERHGSDLQCGTGCSDCCHVRLTVTGVEAAAIRDELASWPEVDRARLAANVAETASSDHAAGARRCAALDPGGRCLIYAARPIVCRSHGAPIRMTERSLPVIDQTALPSGSPAGRARVATVESCFRNFTRTVPEPDCIIDQATLSALVLAVNGGDDRRVDLAELLASC